MTVDLERAFDQLRTHTNVVALPPARAVRRRGDQRRRTRTTAALIGLVALVSLTSAGVVLTLGAGPTVQPAQTPTPTPSQSIGPSPTATAAVTRSEAPPPPFGEPAVFPPGCLSAPDVVGLEATTGGGALPASLTLTAADWGPCYVLVSDDAGFALHDIYWPDLCNDNRPYGANSDRIAGRTRSYQMGPETNAYESVVQYSPGRAAAYLAEIRDRVTECAVRNQPEGGTTYALILEEGFAGDDSLLVYRGEDPDGGYPGLVVGLIRVGDLVAIIFHGGDQGVDRERDLAMAGKAVTYLG